MNAQLTKTKERDVPFTFITPAILHVGKVFVNRNTKIFVVMEDGIHAIEQHFDGSFTNHENITDIELDALIQGVPPTAKLMSQQQMYKIMSDAGLRYVIENGREYELPNGQRVYAKEDCVTTSKREAEVSVVEVWDKYGHSFDTYLTDLNYIL